MHGKPLFGYSNCYSEHMLTDQKICSKINHFDMMERIRYCITYGQLQHNNAISNEETDYISNEKLKSRHYFLLLQFLRWVTNQ